MTPLNVDHQEFSKYYMASASREELESRFYSIVDDVDDLERQNARLETLADEGDEQAFSRECALEKILRLVNDANPKYNETKDMIREILNIIEESGVEL